MLTQYPPATTAMPGAPNMAQIGAAPYATSAGVPHRYNDVVQANSSPVLLGNPSAPSNGYGYGVPAREMQTRSAKTSPPTGHRQRTAPQSAVSRISLSSHRSRHNRDQQGNTNRQRSKARQASSDFPMFHTFSSAQEDRLARTTVKVALLTDLEYDIVTFDWRIKNFSLLRHIGKDKCLPPDGDVLTSPNQRDQEGSEWWLRLYPFEHRQGYDGYVSLFLHTDRALKDAVIFSMLFAAIDADGNEVQGTRGGSTLHHFEKSDSTRNYGFYDFLSGDSMLKSCLHPDGSLLVRCEVRIFTSPSTVVQDRMDAMKTLKTVPSLVHPK